MKPTELRIGNYVKLFLNHTDYDVIQIRIDDLYYINQKNGIYEPILLTEEWFEKFGFYKDGEYWSRDVCDYKYCFKYRDWANNWAFYQEFIDSPHKHDEGMKYPVSFDIKYVHQLQDLWFALQFEELIIKEL